MVVVVVRVVVRVVINVVVVKPTASFDDVSLLLLLLPLGCRYFVGVVIRSVTGVLLVLLLLLFPYFNRFCFVVVRGQLPHLNKEVTH